MCVCSFHHECVRVDDPSLSDVTHSCRLKLRTKLQVYIIVIIVITNSTQHVCSLFDMAWLQNAYTSLERHILKPLANVLIAQSTDGLTSLL